MTETLSLLFALIILLGSIISIISTIGIIRLPDVYTRNHAASKGATLGVLLVLFGAFLIFWEQTGTVNSRLVLAIVFIFLTAPVAGHLISRAAYNSGVPLWEKSVRDDLKVKQKVKS